MKSPLFSSAEQFKSKVLYYPEKRPGYCGWASFFPFGDDAFGLAFNEVCCASGDSASARITLEDYEAAAMPYSYQDITYPFATGKYTNETVYMLSEDRGQSWRQTARVPARTRHYWHVGFGDRSMVRIYSLSPADGEPFGVFSEVSADLGKTWTKTACLMDGYFVFIHKLKKLSNGWIIACGPVFESFGPGYTRRGRHDVSEDVIENIQTCFFCSKDR
ncbi:MAG: hypothetical protein LBR72_04990, partial [Oscillospiraceae bacterium]|nr:hypothetical protein [Oscillospiraceae bacterium]